MTGADDAIAAGRMPLIEARSRPESSALQGSAVTSNSGLLIRPEKALSVTRNSEAVTHAKPGNNERRAEDRKRVRAPGGKPGKKPPSIDGFHWRQNGAGWDLRRSVYVDGRRKQPYVAYLSREAFMELKRRHKGRALEAALSDWIRDREEK